MLVGYYLVKASQISIFLEFWSVLMAMPREERNVGHSKHLVEQMRLIIWHNVLIPAGIGAIHMALALKFACAVFASRMAADDWAMVSFVASCIVGISTGMGVESGLGLVPEFDGGDLYPF